MKKTFLKNNKNIQFLNIGLGLIGGSVAKTIKKWFEVLAIEKNKSHLNYAKKSKVIIGGLEKLIVQKNFFVIAST